ncbi:hypothetical protein KQH56_02450 [bacterium]|nr:hypothetical protein [bacterium]
MKTIYLHIGPRKTGTTTIQKSLYANWDLLLENYIRIPKIGSVFPGSAAQHNLAWELMEYDNFSKPLGTWKELVRCISKTNEEKYIISSEVFSSCNKRAILKIQKYLLDFKIIIIAYLRRQDLLYQSIWSQIIKSGEHDQVSLDFDDWILNNSAFLHQHGYDYLNLLDKWVSVFGKEKIKVRVLEKGQLTGSLFHDFLKTCNVDNYSQYVQSKNQNKSPGIKTLTLMRELRLRLEGRFDKSNRIKFYSFIGSYGSQHGWNNQKLNLIDANRYNKIMKLYIEDNKKIARRFLGRDELFLVPFDEKQLTEFTVEQFRPDEIIDALSFSFQKLMQYRLVPIQKSRSWKIIQKVRAIYVNVKSYISRKIFAYSSIKRTKS